MDGPFLLDPAAHYLHDLEIEGPREAAGDLVLSFREVGAIGIEAVRPKMCTAFGVDQLDVYAYLVTGSPYAALEHVTDAELAANLFHVDRFAPVRKCSIPSDHEAAGNLREIGRQIISNPVCEILLLRIIRKVCKRQDDDRKGWHHGGEVLADLSYMLWWDRLHDWRQRRHGCCIQHVGAHWPGDILDLLLAQIFEPEIKLVAHLIPHDPTDTNPARLGQRLQARGHVDTVVENVALVDDEVPNVDADAEPDPPFVG